MKKLLLLLTAFLVLPAMSFAQTPWAAKGAFPIGTFPGTTSPKMNWDGHGVAVDPDGKVWYQPYYSTDSTNVKWQAKKVATRVIYVFNPDGTQASFSPIKYVTVGGVVDTLGGVTLTSKNAQGVTVRTFDQNTGRGMRVDQNGNVLVMMFNILYRINYKTGAGMNRVEVNNAGARASGYSTGAPAVDKNGNIFVAPVSPGAGPLKMYDKDFNFIGNARNKTYGFSRSFEVSPDGNTIYWAGYTNHGVHVYRRADEFSPFDSLGVVLAGFDTESLTFNPATGQLWASAGSSLDTPNRTPVGLTTAQAATLPKTTWKRRTWYSFDASKLTPKDLTDKETAIESLTWQPYAAADTSGRPRGIGFTKDGKTAYAVTFASATGKDASGATVIYPTLQKFTAPVGGRAVSLSLNTASIADTVTTAHNILVLGSGGALPDGNNMTWDDKSTVKSVSAGGDYWKVSFSLADNTDLFYKFRDFNYNGVGFNDGWENDSADDAGGNHKIAAGTGNVTRDVHFFNATGSKQAYDWRPFRKVGTDSVGVWFRVFMNTVNAVTHGYDSAKGAPVAVRGDDLAGQSQITWDNKTKVTLKRESQDDKTVGYHIYSGLAVYPKAAIGKTQAFKYFVNNDPNGNGGYEDGSDRKIKVPKSDSTVQWVRFGNSKAISGQAPVQKNVTFSVDLTPLQLIGMFDRTQGDSLQVRGDFNGWGCAATAPEKCLLDKVPGAVTYERAVAVKLIPATAFNYKYYLQYNRGNFGTRFPGRVAPSGWEEPLSTTGSNRTGTFDGTKDQTEKTANFDDIELKNIIPAGKAIDVKFRVDMKPVTKGINSAGAAQPFDPTAGDSVFVSFGDPIWLFTQKLPLDAGGGAKLNHKFFLVDPDKDGVYEGTLKVTGPTYDALQYQYSYGQAASIQTEEGGGFTGLGRRRVRFIYPASNTAKNADGTFSSWPTSQFVNKFDAGAEVFTPKGALPFDKNKAGTGSNPVDVDPVDGALPSQVTLSANYPNPFNPSTSFEYTLNRQAQVTVQIYDITGRLVQTLVNEMQGPNTYRVSFDASNMASGVYVYRLQVGDQVLSRKMTFLK